MRARFNPTPRLSVRLIAALMILFLFGCSFHMPRLSIPRVHRITIQQGNVVTQAMIDQLKPGMSRRQVAFIMGEPIIRNSFNPDRWDYVYSILVPNVGATQRRATLFFVDDMLAYFTGDFAPAAATEPASPPASDDGAPEADDVEADAVSAVTDPEQPSDVPPADAAPS